jgi:hypothetical protein
MGPILYKYQAMCFEDVNTSYHWGEPDVDGRIILRWIFRK